MTKVRIFPGTIGEWHCQSLIANLSQHFTRAQYSGAME